MPNPYGYVAYIDEAGDHGTKLIGNADRTGVSEWFTMAAVVVSAETEPQVGAWKREVLHRFGRTQRRDLHFRSLNEQQRTVVCEYLASQPARLFVVMSHKRNMQQYRNTRPRYDKDWFYRWMTRILLERVTLFCQRRSQIEPRAATTLKLVFSRNGWMDYERTKDYLRLLRDQSRLGTMFQKVGDLKWDVIDLDHFEAVDHKNEAGVQFADTVASAFYCAVSTANARGKCDPAYAELLKPRMFSALQGQYLGFGLKTMPPLRNMGLQVQQRTIFESYGYPADRW